MRMTLGPQLQKTNYRPSLQLVLHQNISGETLVNHNPHICQQYMCIFFSNSFRFIPRISFPDRKSIPH